MEDRRKVFDNWAETYETSIYDEVPYYDEMLQAIVRRIPTDLRGGVLDLGCGTGNLTMLVARRLPEVDILAVDYSSEMLRRLQAKFDQFPRQPQIVESSIETLDLKYESLSGVVSNLVLHHLELEGKFEMFQKVYDWLMHGGFFYIGDYVAAPTPELQKLALIETRLSKPGASLDRLEEYGRFADEEMADEMDKPSTVVEQLSMLQEIGFLNLDLVWKRGAYAVWGGEK